MMKALNALGVLVSVIIDTFTSYLINITGDHAHIHQGKAYSVPIMISNLASSGTSKITFLTPAVANGYVHWRPSSISTSGDKVTVNLYEGSSGNSGGSTETAINRNRNSSNTSTVTIKSGVTVSTNGTKIGSTYLGGGTGVGQSRSGSEMGEDNEFVFKPSTLYTIEVINGSGSANNIAIRLFWYEELYG